MENQDIHLQLTTDEINLILEGLGNMPFVKVYALIAKTQQQATGQVTKPTDPSAPLEPSK
jgi:hypothetical protein